MSRALNKMLVNPIIQLAIPGDATAIAEYSRDFIEHGLCWGYTRAKVLRAIASRTTNVAVIRESGSLVAFGIMSYGDTSGHLVLLGVQPARQRQGLGQHVVSWLEQCAVVAGLEHVQVEAREDNAGAVAFYQAQGFRIRQRLPGYYGGALDAIRLRKRLGAFHRDGEP